MSTTALGMTFDANSVEPNTGRPNPVPTGWYNVMMTNAEIGPTRDGLSGKASVQFKIIDGPYAGQILFANLNLWNQNQTAKDIAWKDMAAIGQAVGIYQISDFQQLFGKPLQCRAVLKPAEGTYEASNDIRGYVKIGTHATDGGTATGGAPAAGAVSDPPWAGGAAPAPAAATFTPPAQDPTPAPAAATPAPAAGGWPGATAPAAAAPASAGDITPPWAK